MPVSLQAITAKRYFLPTAGEIKNNLRIAQVQYLQRVRDEMRKYPPPSRAPRRVIHDFDKDGNEITKRGSSRGGAYQRTYRLRESWQIVVSPDGASGLLYNDTKYAVYVQGPRRGGRGIGARQTAVMRSKGWKSISDVARETRREFATVTNRALKGKPGSRFPTTFGPFPAP